jgi:sec-independent protein translocase protein TatB
MFEVGLSEIMIVAIVALVVLGPERLPKAARLAGFWVRKARAQWYTVKAELENEMADEELKNSLKESMADLQQTLNSHQESLRHEMQALDSDLQKLRIDGEDKATTNIDASTNTENSPRP